MKIVCIGDSITYGQNVRADEAWPAVLARTTGWDVRNEGVCGDTTEQALERWDMTVALHRPDAVVIQFGHNDGNRRDGQVRVATARYTENLRELVNRTKRLDARPVVLAPHHAPGKSDEYNAIVRGYTFRALREGALMAFPESVVDDGYGLHPDRAMHERYARLVAGALGAPRSGIHPTAILDGDICLGENASVGYYSLIRGTVRAGRNLRLGSHSSIEGTVTIGDDVTIRGKCEIPNATIGDRVSIYSGVKFYDTPHPPDGPNVPPVIEDDVTICCDTAILGGVTVGKGSFIGARVFVTEDVPPRSHVTGLSAYRVRPRR